MKRTMRESLRIIMALTSKDILEAIKNKTIQGVIGSAVFILVLYRYLPVFQNSDELPSLVVYDAGQSQIVARLRDNQAFDLIEKPSEAELEVYLGDRDRVVLGVRLPSDIDPMLDSGDPVELEGFTIHWANDADIVEIRTFFERQLSQITKATVRIDTDKNIVHTQPDSGGFAFLESVMFVIVISLIGISITPNLMIAEKQSKTLDALMISPATSSDIVTAKALTGLFYCLTASFLALAFNMALISHWWLAILAVVCGSLFIVGLGLMLGIVLEVRQQVSIWTWLLFIPLNIPVFLVLLDDLIPRILLNLFQWIPTVALAHVFRVSFSEFAPPGTFLPQFAITLGWTFSIFILDTCLLRRGER
jgi:ABC-2 type transport system permease protein